jgi:ribonuclease HI
LGVGEVGWIDFAAHTVLYPNPTPFGTDSERGTNNVAECLAAITALEECKKRGITGIRLLSDSQLVVCWTRGVYALRSATSRRYVPQIRQLLAEVGGVIKWVPGSQNLADKYSRGLQDYPADLSPLEKLKTFPPDRLKFKDFLAVKSGRDQFSKLRKANIVQAIGAEEWAAITAAFDKEKYRLSAARWWLRGLPLEAAIRKVQVDREIGHKIAEKRSARQWDDDE